MIVVLHGMPGEEGKAVAYDTGTSTFTPSISVIAAFMPPFKWDEPLSQEAPTFKNFLLVFNQFHYDGTNHHYSLSAASMETYNRECP